MEKRFVVFIVLAFGILMSHYALRTILLPPEPEVAERQVDAEVEEGDAAAAPADDPEPTPDKTPAETGSDEPAEGAAEIVPPAEEDPTPEPDQTWVTLGSYLSDANSPLLVTLNSRGATLERVELAQKDDKGEPLFRDLIDQSGYLGNLSLTTIDRAGARVNALGPNTPATQAKTSSGEVGLQVGDIITALTVAGSEAGTVAVDALETIDGVLGNTRPGDKVSLAVKRMVEGTAQDLEFEVALGTRPFQLIQPEPLERGEPDPQPLSCRLALTPPLQRAREAGADPYGLTDSNWEVHQFTDPAPGVEFRKTVQPAEGVELELAKRFRLGTEAEYAVSPYHLHMEVEIRNRGSDPTKLQYWLEGPNGLSLEGWWYANKIHPTKFKGAGARDIITAVEGDGAFLTVTNEVYKEFKNGDEDKDTILFPENSTNPTREERTLRFLGIDTQYFLSALLPGPDADINSGDYTFEDARFLAFGDLELKRKLRKARTVNVAFRLTSEEIEVAPGDSVRRSFTLYAGPKQPELLSAYELDEAISYGWFWFVARPLSSVLHTFYHWVGNYGIAIIMLTILVRGGMFPLGRKAAKNAAMMQQLAPEMKKIADKYKKDMEKRARAQQELFRKHNYNPLGGCWLMFLQLPIFIGLYRCISVDIELRQAPLIPGLQWCSNLAGPDQMFYWRNDALFGVFTETGLLGPYFNLLPLFTVGLFLVHQKLFTPPATDENTRMQMQMMKFMTVFIGVMFFKVASGLCLYFIASSLWGIAERKLLPKPKLNTEAAAAAAEPLPAKPAPRPKRKQRRR